MNWKPILRLAAAKPAITAAIVGALLAVGAFGGWLHEHDARIRDSVRLADSLTVLRAATARHDAARLAADTVVVHDSIRVTRTVARLDTLWRAIPDTLRTHTDTVRALVALPVIRQQVDSVTRACSALAQSCAAYRASADSTIRDLRAQLAILPRLDAARASTHRVSLSVTGGYGATYQRGWHAGPSFTAGLSWRIW